MTLTWISRRTTQAMGALALVVVVGACSPGVAPPTPRATGYVDATETRIASRVAGRVERVHVAEGATVQDGDVLVELATTDADLALGRARAERAQAAAQWRLLRAGSRAEDVRYNEAQVLAARADERAALADLAAARADEGRFDQLLRTRAGSQKQRDDAVSRRELAEARAQAAGERAAALGATLARVTAGARPEEIEAATARVATVDAQIAMLERDRHEATVRAPGAGVVTARLVQPGEIVGPGAPLLVVIDLAHAWVNAYVDAPLVPALRVGQNVRVHTDDGQTLSGQVAVIATRAEFTPRNVQTAAERAKLVYRVKVATDNSRGILKPGMPVDVDLTAE